jgi:putative salt-induced outer membrane protein YdiY
MGIVPLTLEADYIVLRNGDCISGRVASVEGGKVKLVSDILGTLTIALDKVATLQTDADTMVFLKEKPEPAFGRIVNRPDGLYVEEAGRRQSLRLEDILALGDAAGQAINQADQRWKWSGSVEAGLSGRSGNTNRVSTQGSATIEARKGDWTISGYLHGLYGTQRAEGASITTDNEIKGGGMVQKRLTQLLSAFLTEDLERNKVDEIRLRSLTTGGLGFLWIKNDRWSYENRVGVGQQYEDFFNDEQRTSLVGRLSSVFSYRVNERVELSQATTWLPNLDNQRGYRLQAESAGTIYMDATRRFFLKSGLKNDYNNQPAESVEPLDTYYFTNVGYKF